ncbi:hypothetical protein EW146_g232 [Bondarzewia mesenterica]|uniref:Uncharacterized protein n=1 Tax=Bondarzewia mesenterica TaxID=1095465 RepID=A0A4S4M9V2_9AGAM|nr:hypothetical protein EW146_g232 [Bondarzewia mesenterica]
MHAIRFASKHIHTRTFSQTLRANTTQTRSFYSPFAVLSQGSPSPSTTTPSSSYEKQTDAVLEEEHSARTVYVVSEPDPSDRPYTVPAGAYPTSLPYVKFSQTEAPEARSAQVSSASSNVAHPNLTRRVPQNLAGVGDSGAVRYRDAPGAMGVKGGSFGGLGLMDEASTEKAQEELASRNPQPLGEVAEEYSKLGLEGAWRARK